MGRSVKGVLFADYVRMLRSHRDKSWAEYLKPGDAEFIEQHIDPAGWYPMETFERMGIAILKTVAGEDLEMVRRWGRLTAASVAATVDGIVVPDDPRESLMRFQVYRRSFFDFDSLRVLQIDDGLAELEVDYGMSALAEEAASFQTMGFFEGFIELADGTSIQGRFLERSWAGDPRTVLRIVWDKPPTQG
jgi:hypothetical protein